MTIIRKRIFQKTLNNRNKKAKKNRNRIKDPFVHKTCVSVIQMFKDKIKKNQRVVQNKSKALETIEKRNMIDKIRILNAACLMKKLLRTIPKIRAKLIIEKLKNIKVNKSKYEKLKTSMNHILGKTFNILNN